MLEWLATNVPSLNCPLLVDLHTFFEHIYHNINPSKKTLDFFQVINKLSISTPSHAITIQSFDGALPKIFCKATDHKVVKGTDSLFNNIPTFDHWDEPDYGFRQRLKEERDNTEATVESAIFEGRSLSDEGRALVTIALSHSVQFIDSFIRFIDQTYNQLVRSKYSKQKAWALVSRLIVRIFQDVYDPRNGKQNIMKTADHSQVAVTVFHSSLKSLETMRQHKEYSIEKHPSIASECINCISYDRHG